MRVLTAHIAHSSRSDVIRVKPFFDMHLGTRSCDEKKIDADIAEVLADPNAYALLGGDVCEFIVRSDKRFRQSELASWLQGPIDDIANEQIEYALAKFRPLAAVGKILAVLAGNHETQILKQYERDVFQEIVRGLRKGDKRIGLGYEGFLAVYIQRTNSRKRKGGLGGETDKTDSWRVVFYLHHGYGGGILEGGHALTLGRIFKSYNCDVALMGHRHITAHLTNVQLEVSPHGILRERNQVAAFCGSYRRSYREDDGKETDNASYEEEKGYSPHIVGTPWVKLYPEDRLCRIEI